MNVLFLYNATQTFTNTVFEHLDCFSRYSANRVFFCHQDQYKKFNVDLARFDVVIIHFSVRLPYDQVADSTSEALSSYSGLKALFIQDEYDYTRRSYYWIKRLGIHLVFTVVPTEGIARVYPPEEFPDVRFVSNITGYVPEKLPLGTDSCPPSARELIVGYRGRPLPVRYGELGQEKVEIGRMVKRYCESHSIRHDIAWTEEERIYGPKWYEFMATCRAMLGSESGSNVFDWDGSMDNYIKSFRGANPAATEEGIYHQVVKPLEITGLMNQVSPRIFEALAHKTVLVLFEGNYSGVIIPEQHFIPLKKDGKNLEDVFTLLQDGKYVDAMAERAYRDIIASGKYSYQAFVQMVDREMEASTTMHKNKKYFPESLRIDKDCYAEPSEMTSTPIRAVHFGQNIKSKVVRRISYRLWMVLSGRTRNTLRPIVEVILKNISKISPQQIAYKLWNFLPDSSRDALKPILKPVVMKIFKQN